MTEKVLSTGVLAVLLSVAAWIFVNAYNQYASVKSAREYLADVANIKYEMRSEIERLTRWIAQNSLDIEALK